jgi:hypothetical protein
LPTHPSSIGGSCSWKNDGGTGGSSTNIFIGGPGVTDTDGYPLVNNNTISGGPYKSQWVLLNVSVLLDVSDSLDVYALTSAAVETCRIVELA